MTTNVHTRNSGGAFSLAAEYYVSQSVFQYEQESVFPGHWTCVGHVSEFAEKGAFKTLEIGREPIVVVRDAADQLAAFYNVCRHRGTLVEERGNGVLENNCLTCPYHAWRYDSFGALVSAPNMQNVDSFCADDFGLVKIDVCESFGFVFARLQKNERFEDAYLEPLENILRPWEIANLVRCDALTYTVNANWKLLFLNYSECYHCPIIHPGLTKLTPYKSASNELTSGPVLGGPMQMKDGVSSLTESGAPIGPLFSGLDSDKQKEVRFFTVFPTMFVSPHPDYVMIHRIEPVNASETRVACEFYVTKNTSVTDGFTVDPAKTFWDVTNRQDWHVSEMAQKGIGSQGYRPGPYSNLESVLVEFDRYYMSCMCGHDH